MAELLALRSESAGDGSTPSTAPGSNNNNWFSATNALRVYSIYLELDTDMNGMLSKDELLHYGMCVWRGAAGWDEQVVGWGDSSSLVADLADACNLTPWDVCG